METKLGLLLLLTTTVTLIVQSCNGHGCKLRACFFNDNAQNRPAPGGRFLPEDIHPTLCTHIIYNAARLSGTVLFPQNNNVSSAKDFYKRVLKLKEKKPALKVFLVLIGFHTLVNYFNDNSKNENTIRYSVLNIIRYLRRHKFDGLTIYSAFFRHSIITPAYKQAHSDAIAALRQAFNKEAIGSHRLVLTISVFGERIINDDYYDIPHISENVDWIIFLAHDLHGFWHNTTGHHSPLFADVSKGQRFSVDTAVKHWRKQGTHRHNIVIALPSFGRTYTLTGKHTGEGAPATNGAPGPFSVHPGRLAYFEICSLIQAEGTYRYRLTNQRVPYLVSGNQWVGYDDVTSVIDKIVYIKKRRLGGFALYLGYDDFTGGFCGQGKYPLLTAANKRCDM